MAHRLFIYDTSNFVDYPIGGQVTSITNFLTYICKFYPERVKDIVLVGVTIEPEKLGILSTVTVCGYEIKYLPVVVAQRDLSNVKSSLRIAYVKGLLKHARQLKIHKGDCNYIHTPEAYGVARILAPFTPCIMFSHGNYFDMIGGFRFFQNNPFMKNGFRIYLKIILKTANFVFMLDQDSYQSYKPYNKNLLIVNNSIICPTLQMLHKDMGTELLYVGRLSKDKQVALIMKAAALLGENYHLRVVGNGEEYENLKDMCPVNVEMVGGVTPQEVKKYMKEADILLMNSTHEGIPMAILEGMSYGLPIVSTDVGGIGTVVKFGITGEKTDGTVESIVKAVEQINTKYDEYANSTYQHSKSFDFQVVNEVIYQKVCEYWKTEK